MEYALFAVLMVGCIFAAIEMIRLLAHALLPTRRNTNILTVMPISGRMDDIEYIVRGIIEQKNWTDEKHSGKIILLDLGAEEETVRICKSFAEENVMVELFTPSELEKYLKK